MLKGLARAIIPEVIPHQDAGSSAGREHTATPAPPIDSDTQESTAL